MCVSKIGWLVSIGGVELSARNFVGMCGVTPHTRRYSQNFYNPSIPHTHYSLPTSPIRTIHSHLYKYTSYMSHLLDSILLNLHSSHTTTHIRFTSCTLLPYHYTHLTIRGISPTLQEALTPPTITRQPTHRISS